MVDVRVNLHFGAAVILHTTQWNSPYSPDWRLFDANVMFIG